MKDHNEPTFLNTLIGFAFFLFCCVVGGAALKYLLVGNAPVIIQQPVQQGTCVQLFGGTCNGNSK